jgi:1-acyl-sn-glycerol-3-phosphate acyltransferase
VGMVGTRDVQPPDAPMPRPFRPVWVNLGRPIDVSRYAGRSDDRLLLRQITDEVMYEIRELSGQEYVDEYATKKPEDIPRETAAEVISGNGADDARRSSAEVLAS